ncbi:MAG: D-alanyl-D-alanine carboxypeptidase [Firmicutes bacterium]|nr:D-alanyl-D-alanine carboxypeptidase [Bacillota bacterium]
MYQTGKMIKNTVIIAIVFFLCWQPLVANAQDNIDLGLGSQSAVLMEASSGKILYAKNAEEKTAPASLTKIMTLLLAFEAMEDGRVSEEEQVIISEKAWRTGGSQMFLNIGQKVSFGELLQGIAIVSANDACVAVAEHLFGSEALFVQQMNKKAQELGLINTRFQNSSGLDEPEQYTSAMDMAKLSHYVLTKYPQVLDLFAATSFTFDEIKQDNRNPLLGRYPGADGLKTGFTNQAGYCLVGTAQQNGMRFITVTLNASSENERLADTEALLNYAFRNFQLLTVVTAGQQVTEVPVQKGEAQTVAAEALRDLKVLVPFGQEEVEQVLNLKTEITAPVQKGDHLGTLQILENEEVIDQVELVASHDVEKLSGFAAFRRLLGQVLTNFWTTIVNTITGFFN